jgi:ubiquinone/menaquinone biosynthesis C-methylase UbiE
MNDRRSAHEEEHYQRVRVFHDGDASRYLDARYGAATVVQLGYLVRRQLVLEMIGNVRGDVLDCGCGPGPLFMDVATEGRRLFATDISLEMLRTARSELLRLGRPPLVCASNLVDASLKHASFDCIVCVGVLGYVVNVGEAMREIRRMLRDQGVAILQTSNRLSWKERLYENVIPRIKKRLGSTQTYGLGVDFPLHSYDKKSFDQRLLHVGLDVVDWCYYDFQIPLLEKVSPRLSLAFARKMQRFGRSGWARYLGGGYLVKVSKRQEAH